MQMNIFLLGFFILIGFGEGTIGRLIDDGLPFYQQQSFSRKLHQFIGNCTKGSDQILTEYPSVVSLRNLVDFEQPNINVLCGGVLLSTDTILTSTGCIWQEVKTGVPFNLVMNNPVNRTIDREFIVAISPYCTHGDGAELGEILGYHFMEDGYTGYPKDGNAVTVLELRENVTSLTNSELPALRTTPLPVGSIVTMVGHGATTNQEASLANQNYSRPFKQINYQTISDEECNKFLKNLQYDKVLDGVTEACAVVEQIGEVNICNADDGNPLYDSSGDIAGIITWWPINQCERIRDKTMPIIFADVSKQKVQEFVEKTETESLYLPPNITEGCGDNQTLQAAPWSIAIQLQRINDPLAYQHVCGGVLIDNGTKVVTAAQCVWDNFFPLPRNSLQSSDGLTTVPLDLREPDKPFEGNFLFPIFASLAPRCRHFNGFYPRVQLNDYKIHPQYNGNPQDGNNIAIVGLSEQFRPDQSFPNFEEFLTSTYDLDPPESAFSDVIFYSWGAEFRGEAQEDEKGVFNNYFPAKEVSMELIPDEQCAKAIPLNDTTQAFDPVSELCTDQPSDENFTNICSYDNGGPLVGRLTETNQLVLLGLKSQLQDRQCFDGPGSYEVFTDVIKMKEFILNILDVPAPPSPVTLPLDPSLSAPPPLPPSQGDPSVVVITVVCGSLLLVLVIIAWRRLSYNNKYYYQKTQLLQNGRSSNSLRNAFRLKKDDENIYQLLKNIARKYKNWKTGMPRRHSDLPATLNYMLSKIKIQKQILGEKTFSTDDCFLDRTRETVYSAPVFFTMQQQQSQPSQINSKLPVLRPEMESQNESIQNRNQISTASNYQQKVLHYENENKGVILLDTPARPDFDMTIDFDKELQIGDRLGTGAFGSVYKAVWLTRNMEVVVKIIHQHILEQLMDEQKQGGNFFNCIIGELFLLSRIDSPHVVKCYGGSLKPPKVYLVLEYLSKGNLDQFIHGYVDEIPIGLIMKVAQGIAEGLDALHPTIVHRDLKPQNILLDDSYQVKLADFGLSKMKEDTYLSETMVKGTPAYIAPEALKGESVDEKCDIYALGLIIWEMVAKEHPLRGYNFPMIVARVAINDERPPIPNACPPDLKRLIERCWAPNPRERPTAREVVQRLSILQRVSAKGSNSDLKAFFNHFNNLKKNITVQLPKHEVSSFNFSQLSIKDS